MPTIITEDMVWGPAPHVFNVRAEDIGLKKGEWPDTLETTIGDRTPFRRLVRLDEPGEAWMYQQTQPSHSLWLRVTG